MRHVTVYTSDNEYHNFLELTKNLRYVEKIETDQQEPQTPISMDSWQPTEALKKTLDKALEQDKKTFISRDDISRKYQL